MVTCELELMPIWWDSEPETARLRVTFPINKWAGSADSAVVCFKVEPGDRLPLHTDSAEEILYIVAGLAARRGLAGLSLIPLLGWLSNPDPALPLDSGELGGAHDREESPRGDGRR